MDTADASQLQELKELAAAGGLCDECGGVHAISVDVVILSLALIDPFRRWIVYPSLLRQYHDTWKRVRASAS